MYKVMRAARESKNNLSSTAAKVWVSFPQRITETSYQRMRKLAFDRSCDVVVLAREALQRYIARKAYSVRHSYFMKAGEGVKQNYHLSPEMRDRLQQIHRSTGISLQAILNEAIEAYVEAEES